MHEFEEILKEIIQFSDISEKYNRKSTMARMIFVYESLRRKEKSLEEFLNDDNFTRNQILYVMNEFKQKLKRDEYFKSLYLKALEFELNSKYKMMLVRDEKT